MPQYHTAEDYFCCNMLWQIKLNIGYGINMADKTKYIL